MIGERDVGAPPPCIEDVTSHIRLEMMRPDLGRKYGLRRCVMKLLCGVSGSGKTLATQAIHRRMYEIMSDITRIPIEQLPQRLIKVRQPQVLSKWLAESERNWDRGLDEAEQLADEAFTTVDSRQIKLPVLVLIEEIDGFGRERGHEAIYDRILSTLLERLDPNRPELSERFLIFIATTNTPHPVDVALLRRIGGPIEYFGRLGRRAFRAVLEKHVRNLPAPSRNGCSQTEIWHRNIEVLTNWFFNPNTNDPGLIELTFAGSTTPVTKYRRDFLTSGLEHRAVQQAAFEARQAEMDGCEPAGLTVGQLLRAFDQQLRGIVEHLDQHNVGNYTDLPDGARVATLRRIPQPDHLALGFERE